ncbi:hypothetical protein [Rhizobium sp. Leaf383]|uniref:hypothetical protein n=1 Tax=Rhizobium sp. Leaf383 TaxID=1736357 RepID=UPI000714241E|nr:hypothetical protein [Rhizobium sp. Leaf383]KQS84296.1 hypothetical protein ASG58_21235 [Rhizobium sp. Leaf383]
MLTHNQARVIAEAVWGRGGTHSEPVNRPGAFYFSCSGHGGFVIDQRALKDEELLAISPHVNFEDARIYSWGKRKTLMHPYRTTGARVSAMAREEDFKFFLLEEDCDWCLAYIFTGIRHRYKPAKEEAAQQTFDQWIKPRMTA